jgi:hypothetical protein
MKKQTSINFDDKIFNAIEIGQIKLTAKHLFVLSLQCNVATSLNTFVPVSARHDDHCISLRQFHSCLLNVTIDEHYNFNINLPIQCPKLRQ